MSGGYEVYVLSDGYSYLDDESVMTANCTCTLIKGPKNIIVDTMTPWDSKVFVEYTISSWVCFDIFELQIILDGLREHRLEVDDIDFVVSTHGHPDHLVSETLLFGLSSFRRVTFAYLKNSMFLS